MTEYLNDISKLLDEKLKPLLDMQQQLIDQNIRLSQQINNTPPSKPPKLVRSTNIMNNKEDVTLMKNDQGIYYVTGNTYPINDDSRQLKVWSFNPGVLVDEITESLSSKCKLEDKTV